MAKRAVKSSVAGSLIVNVVIVVFVVVVAPSSPLRGGGRGHSRCGSTATTSSSWAIEVLDLSSPCTTVDGQSARDSATERAAGYQRFLCPANIGWHCTPRQHSDGRRAVVGGQPYGDIVPTRCNDRPTADGCPPSWSLDPQLRPGIGACAASRFGATHQAIPAVRSRLLHERRRSDGF